MNEQRDTWRWVKVSTELLAELGEWSEPMRVRVASITDGVLDMEFQTDAKAAAAPELYEALEDGVNTRMDTEHGAHRWKVRARAALAKARGES